MVIADTGLWVALVHRKDDYHDIAKRRLAALSLQGERLVTTCAGMAEACHLLLARAGGRAQIGFIEQYRQGLFDVLSSRMTRYARAANPYPTGSFNPQETPSFARRDNVTHEAVRTPDDLAN
jgi:predicted nucleic acid-binding protein